jgi:hypothetical protein
MSIPSVNNARVFDSAIAYELPSFATTLDVYHVSPRHTGKFFKGLLVTTAGSITITGCDGFEVAFAVPVGLLPLAGSRLKLTAASTAAIAAILY